MVHLVDSNSQPCQFGSRKLCWYVVGEQPGTRWIKKIAMGKPFITQVELVKGRETMGKQSSWLVTLKGFDTPEKVRHLGLASFLSRTVFNPFWENLRFFVV